MEPCLLNMTEASKLLGIGRTKLYELVKDEKIRTVKIGKSRRVPPSEITRLVEELMAETATR